MSKSDEKDDVDEIDYSDIEDEEIKEIIDDQPEEVQKIVNVGWDGRQHIIRIPTEVSEALDIEREDEVEFEMVKHPPKSEKSDELKIIYKKFDGTKQ